MTEQTVTEPSPGEVGAVIRGFVETLRKTQFMPPERMREYQRGLLERLLRHARTQVPFYRDSGRLDPLFRGDSTIDWDRWGKIPPLTRRELQDNAASLITEIIPFGHGRRYVIATSGSTGEPARRNGLEAAAYRFTRADDQANAARHVAAQRAGLYSRLRLRAADGQSECQCAGSEPQYHVLQVRYCRRANCERNCPSSQNAIVLLPGGVLQPS
jgi:hypothetical protein